VTYSVPASTVCDARSITDTISISTPPTAAITMEMTDNKLCQNTIVTLQTPAGLGWIYNWYPKDYFPDKSNLPSVTAKLIKSGEVYVTVSTQEGCRRTDSINMNTEVCCNVMIPTAFTPNGDGANDIFKVYSQTTQNINQLSVFNRLGQRIFTSYAQEKGWDGTHNDKPVDAGVYFYYLKYTCSDGKIIEKKGDVSLIR
jgi:gliding motility-associated-like protein